MPKKNRRRGGAHSMTRRSLNFDSMANRSQNTSNEQAGPSSTCEVPKPQVIKQAPPIRILQPDPVHEKRGNVREDDGHSKPDHGGSRCEGTRGESKSPIKGHANREVDETPANSSLGSDANAERTRQSQIPSDDIPSPDSDASGTYTHPTYLRPDFIDILNQDAKAHPPQLDPWGVRTNKFRTFFRHLVPPDADDIGELGACIYISGITRGLDKSQVAFARNLIRTRGQYEADGNHQMPMGSRPPGFPQHTAPKGPERPGQPPTRGMLNVGHIVNPTINCHYRQVPSDPERQNRPYDPTKNIRIPPNFGQPGYYEPLNYKHYNHNQYGKGPPLPHPISMHNVPLSPGQTLEDQRYAAAMQAAAAMTMPNRTPTAGGMPIVVGVTPHQQQQMAAAAHQYHATQAHMHPPAGFNARRMPHGHTNPQAYDGRIPLYKR